MSNQISAFLGCECLGCFYGRLEGCSCDLTPGTLTYVCNIPDDVLKECRDGGGLTVRKNFPTDAYDCYTMYCEQGVCPPGAPTWEETGLYVSGGGTDCETCCGGGPDNCDIKDPCCIGRPERIRLSYGLSCIKAGRISIDTGICNQSIGGDATLGCCAAICANPPSPPLWSTCGGCPDIDGVSQPVVAYDAACTQAAVPPGMCGEVPHKWQTHVFDCACCAHQPQPTGCQPPPGLRTCSGCGPCGCTGMDCGLTACCTSNQAGFYGSTNIEFTTAFIDAIDCEELGDWSIGIYEGRGKCPVRVGYIKSICATGADGYRSFEYPNIGCTGCDPSTVCPSCATLSGRNMGFCGNGYGGHICETFEVEGTWRGRIGIQTPPNNYCMGGEAFAEMVFTPDPGQAVVADATFRINWDVPDGTSVYNACGGLTKIYSASQEWIDFGYTEDHFGYYGYAGAPGAGVAGGLQTAVCPSIPEPGWLGSASTPIQMGYPSIPTNAKGMVVGPSDVTTTNPSMMKQYGCKLVNSYGIGCNSCQSSPLCFPVYHQGNFHMRIGT